MQLSAPTWLMMCGLLSSTTMAGSDRTAVKPAAMEAVSGGY